MSRDMEMWMSVVLIHKLFFIFLSVSVKFVDRGHSIKVLVFFIIGIKPYLSDGLLIAQIDASNVNWIVYPQSVTQNL
jgi:hypothetical protein